MNAYKLLAWQAVILTSLCLAHASTPALATDVDLSALDRLIESPPVMTSANPSFAALDRLIDEPSRLATATLAADPCFDCLDALCESSVPDFSALDKLLEVKSVPDPVPIPPKPAATQKPLPVPPVLPLVPAARTQQPALHPMPVPTCNNGQCLNLAPLMNLSPKELKRLGRK
ncbi:hypothetical protein [Planctopirus hydrillae]|uniref:Secreted protein n=1 Tax=Planctopirus hydrillae TaxID=1841610 RepID=A0A1C3E7P3_9PLAN|nr:hypothetical protein [Planctopirus hydrillae]ODA29256.1 hypothetical protein A6X21_09150 [Planctopirus hydrillae]